MQKENVESQKLVDPEPLGHRYKERANTVKLFKSGPAQELKRKWQAAVDPEEKLQKTDTNTLEDSGSQMSVSTGISWSKVHILYSPQRL